MCTSPLTSVVPHDALNTSVSPKRAIATVDNIEWHVIPSYQRKSLMKASSSRHSQNHCRPIEFWTPTNMAAAYAIGAATVLGSLAMLAWRPAVPWTRSADDQPCVADAAPLARWTHGFVRDGAPGLAGGTPGGFHHRYAVRMEVFGAPAEEDCAATVSWRMPRDVFVDQWMLARTAADAQWDFGPAVVDLEAPAYSEAARPFVLRASVPLRAPVHAPQGHDRAGEVVIPDLAARYQAPRAGGGRSDAALIHPPTVAVSCGGRAVRVRDSDARPLEVSVPVAAPSLLVAQATYAAVLLSCAHVFVSLLRF